MKRLLVILLCFSSNLSVYSQTIISGSLKSRLEKIVITIYRPIDGYYNYSNADTVIELNAKQNPNFRIVMPNGGFGYWKLTFNQMPLHFVLHPGDSIYLDIDFTKMSIDNFGNWIEVSEHAREQGFLSINEFLLKRIQYRPLFEALFENQPSVQRLFTHTIKIIDSLLEVFHLNPSGMPIGNQSSIMAIYRADLLGDCINTVLKRFNFLMKLKSDRSLRERVAALEPDKKQFKVTKHDVIYTPARFCDLAELFHQYANPFDEVFLKTSVGNKYAEALVEIGVNCSWLPKNRSAIRLPNLGIYNFLFRLPLTFQQYFLADNIIYQINYNQSDYDVDAAIRYYISQYPLSEYAFILKKKKSSLKSNNSDNSNTDYTIIAYSPKFRKLETLLSAFFQKDDYVLIDVWATWCKPCIEEFAYKEKLDSLLDRLKIKRLYLSLDPSGNKRGWANFIKKNRIKGTHILIPPGLSKDLISKIFKGNKTMPIPSLALARGNKVILVDLPVISSGNSLEEILEKIIR